MKNDISLLYYTDNTIQESIRQKIADYLLEVTENKYPIVSVSQKPIDLGHNICIGEIGKSKHNLYKQILTGVREVKTKYVALAEDDTLYSPEHFLYRPEDDACSCNTNGWFAQPEKDFYWRVRNHETDAGGFWGAIARTEILLKDMEHYFKLNPIFYGGDGTSHFLSRAVKRSSKDPCVTFIHEVSMGYNQFRKLHRRHGHPLPEDKVETLEQFGNIKDLWKEYWE